MGAVKLKYVQQINGSVYFAVRIGGKLNRTPLPKPDDPEFAVEYQRHLELHRRLKNASVGKTEAPAGTFDALFEEFKASPNYRTEIKDATRRDYDLYIRDFSRRFGHLKVRTLTRPIVLRMRDQLAEKPAYANAFVSKLSAIISFGIDRGYTDHNAAKGIKRLKMGEHLPWPPELIERILATASPLDRLIVITGLCSGQRVSDCIRLKRSAIQNGMVPLIQEKTDKPVWAVVHPLWQDAMDECFSTKSEFVLFDRTGNPFGSTDAIQQRIRIMMETVGVKAPPPSRRKDGEPVAATGERYTFHGLRKNATNYLADIGLTPSQISAITGMTLSMIEHYTRAIRNRKIVEGIRDRVMAGDMAA